MHSLGHYLANIAFFVLLHYPPTLFVYADKLGKEREAPSSGAFPGNDRLKFRCQVPGQSAFPGNNRLKFN
jgi:hypothetical protein